MLNQYTRFAYFSNLKQLENCNSEVSRNVTQNQTTKGKNTIQLGIPAPFYKFKHCIKCCKSSISSCLKNAYESIIVIFIKLHRQALAQRCRRQKTVKYQRPDMENHNLKETELATLTEQQQLLSCCTIRGNVQVISRILGICRNAVFKLCSINVYLVYAIFKWGASFMYLEMNLNFFVRQLSMTPFPQKKTQTCTYVNAFVNNSTTIISSGMIV